MKPFTIYMLAVAVLAAAVVLLIFGEVQHSLVNLGVLFVCASALMAIAFYGVYPSRWGNPKNAAELSKAIARKWGLEVSNITDWAINEALTKRLISDSDPVWKVIEELKQWVLFYDPSARTNRGHRANLALTLDVLNILQRKYPKPRL